jgi:hypothetical protein
MCSKFTAIASWGQVRVCATLIGLLTSIGLLTASSRDRRATDIKQCIAKVEQEASQGKLDYLLETAESAEERHDKMGGRLLVACNRRDIAMRTVT